MKKIVTQIMLMLCFMAVFPVKADAKPAGGTYGIVIESKKIGNTVYKLRFNESKKFYVLKSKKKGKTKVIAKNVIGPCAVNKKFIYYFTGELSGYDYMPKYKNRKLIRYHISSGKKEKVVSVGGAKNANGVLRCDGKYLYFGECTQYLRAYDNLHVLNLKNKKIVNVKRRASGIRTIKNRLLVEASVFPHGGNLFLMDKNGKKVKDITLQNVNSVSIKKGYIYFQETTYDWKVRKCRCKLDGTGYQVLRDWEQY